MSPQGKSAPQAEPATVTPDAQPPDETADSIAQHVEWAVSTWPQIDPEVEGIVSRVDKIDRYMKNAFRASLGQAGLTKEEWKVILALSRGVRSHGWLCRDLDVSTGAMTNRLDKLEDRGFIKRTPDPEDRRGVLLELTDGGRERLEEYIDAGAGREKELLSGLSLAEKQELNALLSRLLRSLQQREPEPRC
jgi:DNA-binding MarR family transcriptional regulator